MVGWWQRTGEMKERREGWEDADRLDGLSPVATRCCRWTHIHPWIFIEVKMREIHTIFMPFSIKHISISERGVHFISINAVSIIHIWIRRRRGREDGERRRKKGFFYYYLKWKNHCVLHDFKTTDVSCCYVILYVEAESDCFIWLSESLSKWVMLTLDWRTCTPTRSHTHHRVK